MCKPGTLPILYVLINVTQVVFEKPSLTTQAKTPCVRLLECVSPCICCSTSHTDCARKAHTNLANVCLHTFLTFLFMNVTHIVFENPFTQHNPNLLYVCALVIGAGDGDDAVSHQRMRRGGQGCA